jgi:carbamoyl-phosphate synthase large subunit
VASAEFLGRCGIATPRSFSSLGEAQEALRAGRLEFPLVVKPRWGVSSIGTYFVEDAEELQLSYLLSKKQVERTFLAEVCATDPERCILIQERLIGTEYGLDVVNDLARNYVTTFARRKLRMRAGQTDQAMTVDEERLAQLGRLLGERLGHVGLMDCDVFETERGLHVIDLNPRVGGGYPFAHVAGANYPAALIAWACGETPSPEWLRVEPDVVSSTCDRLIRNERGGALVVEPEAPPTRPVPCAA